MSPRASEKDDFAPRRHIKGSPRAWVWEKNRRITIRERRNASGGIGYRVTFPASVTGGKVLLLQSNDLEEAMEIGRNRGREFQQSRSTALILDDAQKIQAAAALRHLKEHGIEKALDEVARLYCQAQAMLDPHDLDVHNAAKALRDALQLTKPTGKSLTEVVGYAVTRLCPPGGAKKLSELVREMIEMKRGWLTRGDLRPASFADFQDRAGRISVDLGTIPLAELTKDWICEWLKGLKVAPRTSKNYRMVLAEILRFAQQKRFIATSPMSELTRNDIKELEGISNEARQPAILSPKQAEALIRAAFKHADLDLGAAVILALFGEFAPRELKRLKWDALRLDEEHPFVIIGPEIAKKRRIRNVPLPECAIAWLQRWPRTSDKVTRTLYSDDYRNRFKKLYRQAKIRWESNMMRHSFGSYHYAKYGNPLETARILGHKGDDAVLFAHYRALATKAEGDAYFAIVPKSAGSVIAFPAAAEQR